MNQQAYVLNAIAWLLFSSLVPGVQAAPQIPEAGLLMRENRKMPEIPKKESEANVENTEQQRPPMQRQNDLQVTVEYFAFSGNTQFSNAELQALLVKYKGHPVSFDDLQAAGMMHSRWLFERLKSQSVIDLTDIQRAARYYSLNRMAFGGGMKNPSFGYSRASAAGLSAIILILSI
jgi:hypothetical protein